MSLTSTKIENAKPDQKPYKLADEGGLYLLIKPDGARYWRLKYRFAGRCITTLPPRLVGRRPRARSGYKLRGRALMLLSLEKSGAGNESRTRDLNLGKVALYQLSYSRERKLLIIQ